jgi:hypothetical protein
MQFNQMQIMAPWSYPWSCLLLSLLIRLEANGSAHIEMFFSKQLFRNVLQQCDEEVES